MGLILHSTLNRRTSSTPEPPVAPLSLPISVLCPFLLSAPVVRVFFLLASMFIPDSFGQYANTHDIVCFGTPFRRSPHPKTLLLEFL